MAWLKGQLDSPDNALVLRNNNRSYYSRGVQSAVGLATSLGDTGHDLQIGIRLHEDEEDRFQHDDLYTMRDSRLELTSAGMPGSQSNRISDSAVTAVFIEDRITAGSWVLTPGVRMERIRLTRTDYATSDPARSAGPTRVRTNTVDILIPGLGATYAFDNSWRLLAGAHRGFNPPAPGSLADVEDSRNFELGARYKENGLNAEAIAFYNDYRNLVGTCTASTGDNCEIGDQFDGGEATVFGLESLVSYEFPVMGDRGLRLPVRLAYTWTPVAEFDTGFTSGFDPWGEVESGYELPYMPEHQLQIAADLLGQNWRAGINASFVDEARTVAGQGDIVESESTDERWVLDLAGSYRLSDGFELYGRIDNVLDDAHVVSRRPAGLRPGKPRSVIFGFRFRS
jgi:Fe(3+) dicitrate transport protein